jgi:hypothetical protein
MAEQAVGVYKATRVSFIMPGAWNIRVKLQDGNALVEQAILPVTIR